MASSKTAALRYIMSAATTVNNDFELEQHSGLHSVKYHASHHKINLNIREWPELGCK